MSSTDFWTTRCTRCPKALDDLNEKAGLEKNESVQFISICCDKLDGAREIIEKFDKAEEETRWNKMEHYFMQESDKEEAKRILGFQAVPFYVILNENGEIEQKGNKVDFSQFTEPIVEEPVVPVTPAKKPEMERMDSPTDARDFDFGDVGFDLDF